MRNSDPDAAVYWLARMVEAGEDPLYIARRLVRFASEDVGNADDAFRLLLGNTISRALDNDSPGALSTLSCAAAFVKARLEEAARSYEEQVSEAVASDEETAAYVEELERRADQLEEANELPSGDALAAELTRFLREREQNGGGEDAAREQ